MSAQVCRVCNGNKSAEKAIPAFVISQSCERAARARRSLAAVGVCENVVHVQAVDGRALFESDGVTLRDNANQKMLSVLSMRAFQTLRNPPESCFDIRSPGAIGCYMSHASIWRTIVDSGLSSALVFEDDVDEYSAHVHDNASVAVQQLVADAGGEQHFDFLWLSFCSTLFHGGVERPANYSNHLLRTRGPGQCTQAYLVTARGATKLLQAAFPIALTTDAFVAQMAAVNDDFVLLRPPTSLFKHPFTNFLTSTIGYNVVETLPIIIPVQWRLPLFVCYTALLVLAVCAFACKHCE